MLRSLVGSEMCIRDRISADITAGMTEEALRSEVADLTAQLVAATTGVIDPIVIAKISADITAGMTEIEDLTAAVDAIKTVLNSSKADLSSVREELRMVQEAAVAASEKATEEILKLNTDLQIVQAQINVLLDTCLLYTSPSPRDS